MLAIRDKHILGEQEQSCLMAFKEVTTPTPHPYLQDLLSHDHGSTLRPCRGCLVHWLLLLTVVPHPLGPSSQALRSLM